MGRGQRGSKGQLCANKVELGPGMQYSAAEQQERWQDWRENLWQMEITALSNPGNTRDGEEGQEGKQKPENDMPVTRPLSASEHLVHWDRCPHLGWNAVILYPSPTSTQCQQTQGTAAIHPQRFLKGFCSGVTGLNTEGVLFLENNHLISQLCISQRSSRHGGL